MLKYEHLFNQKGATDIIFFNRTIPLGEIL